jgi:hypothetical protein
MPYLRLYLPEIPVARKRQLARKLIDTTLRTFQLHPSDRDQITIQFLTSARTRPYSRCKVEVACRELPAANKRAFAENVAPLISRSLHLENRLAWLRGSRNESATAVDIRFTDLSFDSGAASEPSIDDILPAEWNRVA